MADIDRMFRSEFALLAEQPPARSDIWSLDTAFDPPSSAIHFDDVSSDWDISAPPVNYPSHAETTLGLFPAPDCRLGGLTPTGPYSAHLHPTVCLSDVSLGTTEPIPQLQIPLSTSSSGTSVSQSPAESLTQADPSSGEMDSDDLELVYPSDSEYLPSPVSINPATLSAASTSTTMDLNADILTNATAIRASRRMSRTITKVPVPIPNLTKKSRGRKVPTSNGGPIYSASRDKTKKGVRTYTCTADGCGKCFVRGEHLKRHIRSIHTEEKPWECTYKDCKRTFSRQDNLNQHLRIHRMRNGDD